MIKYAGLLLLGTCLLNPRAYSCTENGTGFLPENDLKIPVSEKNSGISEARYHAVIDKVSRVYEPIVKSHGATLRIDRRWASDVVNAGTYRDESNNHWHINLYGGFARHPQITEDGFALVICHEIGHHIGGAPKKLYSQGAIWASTEGQSDYFATLKCLRKVFADDDNISIVDRMEVPRKVRNECRDSFQSDWEAALCMRTSIAGHSVTKVNADSRQVPHPDFDVTDPTVVASTSNFHPVPQCRLDTYFQGSLCPIPSSYPLSQTYETKATCHPNLQHQVGLRPHCWFKPLE